MHGACGVRRGHVGISTHGRDSAGRINKNGAVLKGRRRDWMDAASSDAKQLRLSAIGYWLPANPIADS